MFPVLCFRFLPAAASSALCAFSRRRLCASSSVSGVPLAPSLPVLACAPVASRRCSALCVRALSVPHATSRAFRCAALAARAPLSLPQSELGAADLRVCAVRAARSLRASKKHRFELNAPLGGAGFPVLECPSLFAPLALTRCGRLARRVFPGCKEAFSASDRNTNRINIFLNLRRLSRSSR